MSFDSPFLVAKQTLDNTSAIDLRNGAVRLAKKPPERHAGRGNLMLISLMKHQSSGFSAKGCNGFRRRANDIGYQPLTGPKCWDQTSKIERFFHFEQQKICFPIWERELNRMIFLDWNLFNPIILEPSMESQLCKKDPWLVSLYIFIPFFLYRYI